MPIKAPPTSASHHTSFHHYDTEEGSPMFAPATTSPIMIRLLSQLLPSIRSWIRFSMASPLLTRTNSSTGFQAKNVMGLKAIIDLLIVFSILLPNVSAKNYIVGGDYGWSENVNMTAWLIGRTFQSGDFLVFRYSLGYDVLETTEGEYNTCMINNRISSHNNGYTVVLLNSTGTRYFVCGAFGHCFRGMKLRVNVVSSDESDDTQRPVSSPIIPPPENHHQEPPTTNPDAYKFLPSYVYGPSYSSSVRPTRMATYQYFIGLWILVLIASFCERMV